MLEYLANLPKAEVRQPLEDLLKKKVFFSDPEKD